MRRRQRERRLFAFELHNALLGGNGVALADQYPDHFRSLDIFAQLRQLEFNHALFLARPPLRRCKDRVSFSYCLLSTVYFSLYFPAGSSFSGSMPNSVIAARS